VITEIVTRTDPSLTAETVTAAVMSAVPRERASAGDWTAYAAEVSRRAREPHT
jgi:hypothetical protein